MAELWNPPTVASRVVGSLGELYDFFRRGAIEPYCPPRRITAATTLLPNDRLLLVDTSGGVLTVTLGAARTYPIQPYRVKLIAGANNVTLDADGTENIYTTAGAGTLVWNTTGTSYTIIPCIVAAPNTWGWVVA